MILNLAFHLLTDSSSLHIGTTVGGMIDINVPIFCSLILVKLNLFILSLFSDKILNLARFILIELTSLNLATKWSFTMLAFKEILSLSNECVIFYKLLVKFLLGRKVTIIAWVVILSVVLHVFNTVLWKCVLKWFSLNILIKN